MTDIIFDTYNEITADPKSVFGDLKFRAVRILNAGKKNLKILFLAWSYLKITRNRFSAKKITPPHSLKSF